MIQRSIQKIVEQYQVWRPDIATRNILYHWQTRERKKVYGQESPDTVYYVIRSIQDKSPFYIGPIHNLMANFFYVLSHLQYAQKQGWTPVIDQLNYPVYNSLSREVNGTRNAWEYFWEQPDGICLDKVYRGRHVILSKQSWYGQWDMGYEVENYTNRELISEFHRFSQWVPLNQTTEQQVQMGIARFLPNAKKTLGVSVRFGGHAKNCYYHGQGHPIQPEIDELLLLVEKLLEQWGMEYIFLASDEEISVCRFQERFGSRLSVMPRVRSIGTLQYNEKQPNPMYESEQIFRTSLEYLIEMEILARCNALIGSITSGLRYALVKNNNRYEHVNIIDCGRFPDPRRRRSSSS